MIKALTPYITNIKLATQFTKRELKDRYLGTGLGQFWFILSPLIMIVIYSVIFSDIMKMKLNVVDNSYGYSIYLISGLLPWISFSTIITVLNTSFFDKAPLIKKINVPMYTFQFSTLLSEFMVFFISMLLGIFFLIIVSQPITTAFLWLPLIMVLQTLFAFAIGVICSLFTPFFKDMKVALPIVIQLWFWMTPIIYMKELIEKKFPLLIIINPFYYFVDTYQNIFLLGRSPALETVGIIILMTFSAFLLAGYLYKKMVSSIKDII